MSPGNKRYFSIDFDSTISGKSIIAFLLSFWVIAGAWAKINYDLNTYETTQKQHQRILYEIPDQYVTKEQLRYIVVERIDRLEAQLNDQLDRIEKKINE